MKPKPESPFRCPGHHVNLHPLGGHVASHSRGKLPVGDDGYKEGPGYEQWRAQIIRLPSFIHTS